MTLLLLILLSLMLDGDSAEPVIPIPEVESIPSITVNIKTVEIPLGQDSIDLELTCNSNGMAIGGFELIVETVSRQVEILAINQGEFQQQCNWEQFSSRRINFNGAEQRWHMVALASMGSIDTTRCFVPDTALSIARISLRIKPPEIYTDTLYPVYFAWNRCSDNSFSDTTGSKLLIGKVKSWSLPTPWYPQETMRNYQGPPMNCFTKSKRPPLNAIQFHNGGVIVRSDIPPFESSDSIPSDTIPPAGVDGLN